MHEIETWCQLPDIKKVCTPNFWLDVYKAKFDNDLNKIFVKSAKFNKIGVVKLLVKENISNSAYEKALYYAVNNESTALIKLLLANIKYETQFYNLPAESVFVGNLNILKLLLDHEQIIVEKDLFVYAAFGNKGEIVEYLLKLNDPRIDLTATWNGFVGDTTLTGDALFWMVYHNNVAMFKTLLLKKDYFNLREAFKLAIEKGNTTIIILLLLYINLVSFRNDYLAIAARHGQLEVVKIFMADKRINPAAFGNVALKEAAKGGHLKVVKELFKDERVKKDYKLAFEMAAKGGHSSVVNYFLQQGPQIDAIFRRAKQLAGQNKHRNIIRILNQYEQKNV